MFHSGTLITSVGRPRGLRTPCLLVEPLLPLLVLRCVHFWICNLLVCAEEEHSRLAHVVLRDPCAGRDSHACRRRPLVIGVQKLRQDLGGTWRMTLEKTF